MVLVRLWWLLVQAQQESGSFHCRCEPWFKNLSSKCQDPRDTVQTARLRWDHVPLPPAPAEVTGHDGIPSREGRRNARAPSTSRPSKRSHGAWPDRPLEFSSNTSEGTHRYLAQWGCIDLASFYVDARSLASCAPCIPLEALRMLWVLLTHIPNDSPIVCVLQPLRVAPHPALPNRQ